MVKGKIEVPKVDQACKDGKCGHQHEFPFEIEDPKPQEPQQPAKMTLENQGQQQTTQLQTKEDAPRPLKHEEIQELQPVNFMRCPGGNCGHQKLEAKNFEKKFKTCENCESNSVRKDQPCPTCGKDYTEHEFNELDDGVDLEEEE